MPISVNPIFPVIAAQGAAPELVLQPGMVVDAQVLKILSNDLVRIAIANLSIEVFSEIPLQAGQSLQLAVSQTADGIKLAVVGQGHGAGPATPGSGSTFSNGVSPDIVDIAPFAAGISVTNPVALKDPLTPMQALAVSAAAQAAATRQNSLAPLFANLDAVVRSDLLPPRLQQAVAQTLALRPDLDQNLTSDGLKHAFQNSGLFLEASLASGRAPASGAGVTDLKAALLVLRQTLQALGTATQDAAIPQAVVSPPSVRSAHPETEARQADAASRPLAPSPPLAPQQTPEIEVEEVLLPQARLPVAEDFSQSTGNDHILSAAPPRRDTGLGTETVPLDQLRPENPAPRAAGDRAAVHTNVPPPPFRGALPSAQPALLPSLAADAPLATIVHRLADDTDAAIARQTLLQVASLPDRAEIAGLRTESAAPRWNFEIPFSTPAGTAIAQFEIARDGTGHTIDAAKPVWRARFSLDIEPAGPVHALISLAGGRTSVRMWAERPATVTRLRAGVSQLDAALSRAELQPGDIVIRHGMPTRPPPAPAGYFLDRAL